MSPLMLPNTRSGGYHGMVAQARSNTPVAAHPHFPSAVSASHAPTRSLPSVQ